MSKQIRAAVASGLFALALSACNSMPSLSVSPRLASAAAVSAGQSEKDVEAALGKPTEVLVVEGGLRVMFYNHAPGGGQTDAVVLGPDGRVRAVEKRLTRENASQLVCGRTTSRAVRALLGPPLRVEQKASLGREEWMYRFSEVGWSDPILLYVAFSRDGVVREVYAAADQRVDQPSSNVDLLRGGNATC